MTDHSSKIALVTGANRGIGREIARQLAARGVRVVLSGRDATAVTDAANALSADGERVESLRLDVTDADSITEAAEAVHTRYGRLDILVQNAAIRVERYGRNPSEQPVDQWRQTFETNLFGVVAVGTAFLPLLRRSVAGRIVHVSSLLGSLVTHTDRESYTYDPTFKSLPAYSASKTAVNSWTVHLAYELRDTPIKVNSVHPGYTKTGLNDGAGDQDVAAGARTSVEMALLGADGPTGTFVHRGAVLPW